MANRLSGATSPYLQQHAGNPVDWHQWGDEAISLARAADRPIFLSIGYSACHWCHVMERESFEDAETAQLMNREFVNIKVDREERPDLDSIYMAAVQQMTGSGGWPMSVFLTPELEPFFGGTYFPPEPRFGMPAFRDVLEGAADAWRNRRDEVVDIAAHLTAAISTGIGSPRGGDIIDKSILESAAAALMKHHDPVHGGFGGAPKFPQAMALDFMLRRAHATSDEPLLEAVEKSLTEMARGGIWDHLGGGFARYSTDQDWLVPHFEKMLYDQALLAATYLHAYQATGRASCREVCTRIIDYVLRDLGLPEGGFASAEDADSEGVEGKFYTWGYAEARDVCGEDFDAARLAYNLTEAGNWEGTNILHVSAGASAGVNGDALERARARMFEARLQRPRPFRDDKVITGWNGLMLAAIAEAGAVLARPDYLAAAQRNANFLLDALRPGGRLSRTWRAGQVGADAYLEDYAALAGGLLSLYEADFDPRWYVAAQELAEQILSLFGAAPEDGVFYSAPAGRDDLIHRPRDFDDNAVPAGNSLACEALLRLSLLSGEAHYRERAVAAIAPLAGALAAHPLFFGRLLSALDLHLGDPVEVAVVGDLRSEAFRSLIDVARAGFSPNQVLAAGPDGTDEPPLMRHRAAGAAGGAAAAYVCRNFSCEAPVADPEGLRRLLSQRVPQPARWQVI